MNSTGNLWMQQMIIHYFTNQFAAEATEQGSDTMAEAIDTVTPADHHQPASRQQCDDPEGAAQKMT